MPDEQDEAALLARALEAFNSGDFYTAHDLFEALWGEDFYKGLVQAAVALHHYSVGNLKGVAGLPENVERILTPYLPVYAGLDVARFLRGFQTFFAAVARGERPDLATAPRLVPAAGP